jgi:hypothetical protein
MADSVRSDTDARLLTLLDLAQAVGTGTSLGADFADADPAPNLAADLEPAVSVAGDAPTIAADGAFGPASVAADLG